RACALPRRRLFSMLSRDLPDRPQLSARHRRRGCRAGSHGRGHRMKTVLHTEASPGLGGQEIRTLHEAQWTAERGWRAIVACQADRPLYARAREAGVEAVPIRMRSPWDVRALGRLVRVLSREQVSIVHTHSSVDAWVGGAAARIARVPVVRTRHVSIP